MSGAVLASRGGLAALLRYSTSLLALRRRRALVAYAVVLVVWELSATSGEWLGTRLPVLGNIPSPLAACGSFKGSWQQSSSAYRSAC